MSREERILHKLEMKKQKREESLRRSDKLKSKISSINISTGESSDDDSDSPGRIDSFYDSVFGNALSIFTAKHYPEVDIPEERIMKTMVHSDGTVEPVYVIPELIRPWVCNYFHTPRYKARLAISIVGIILAILAVVLSLSLTQTASVIASVFILLALLVNVTFRYLGIALWKYPMPRIPYFSDLRIDRSEEVEENVEEEYDSYEEALESSEDKTDLVQRVERVRNGHMSPATLLTRWMNGPARMSESDLIAESGGVLDSFRIRLMMKDDEEVWTDSETIDALSKITNSRPKQWREAWENWNNG